MFVSLLSWTASAGPRVEASSSLNRKEQAERFSPANVLDRDLTTAWAEGAEGSGVGEWLSIPVDSSRELHGLIIFPGHMRSPETLKEYGAPSGISLTLDDREPVELTLPGLSSKAQICRGEDCTCAEYLVGSARQNFGGRIVLLSAPGKVNSLRLRILEVYRGTRVDDTAISEVVPIYSDGGRLNAREPRLSAAATALRMLTDRSLPKKQRLRVPKIAPSRLSTWWRESFGGSAEHAPGYGRCIGAAGSRREAPAAASAFLDVFTRDRVFMIMSGAAAAGKSMAGQGELRLEAPLLAVGEADSQGRIFLSAVIDLDSAELPTSSGFCYRLHPYSSCE